MFEYSIQKAWDSYHKDFGIGRIMLFVAFYNTFLFWLSGFFYERFRLLALLPAVVAFVFFLIRPKILKLPTPLLLISLTVPLSLSLGINYTLIGQFDYEVGGLLRLDPFFVAFDEWLFGGPVALFFAQVFSPLGSAQVVLYDFMMFSYFSYFFLPFYGAYLYYRYLPPEHYHYIGRYFASLIIYFNVNYLFYLGIPVTGPQYFLEKQFTEPLPLSEFGQTIHAWIQSAQSTYIDCFPSGHVGISVVVFIWLIRLHHPQRYLIFSLILGIAMATLAMRYHYVLDVLAAFPLALFCYAISYQLIPLHSRPSRDYFPPEL